MRLIALLSLVVLSVKSLDLEVTSSSDILLDKYDQTIPPKEYTGTITEISYSVDFKSVKNIQEKKMHIILNFFETLTWYDPRLEYKNNTKIPEFLRNNRIDATRDRYSVWMPNLAYTEENFSTNSSETMYIYPTGTVVFNRKL
jgi:hypothetical protein